MNQQSTQARHTKQPCRLSLAIAMALFAAGQLHAQTAPATTDQATQTAPDAKKDSKADKAKAATAADEKAAKQLTGLTVNGYSSSLNRAQDIKRFSDTVVDAISAQDAGSLPDLSVTEALQRVPGVAVSAAGIPNDPDHFSIQGTDISLQGLPYTSTLFNGRQVFSAGGGQGLNFSTVSPELIGSVVVSKNQTADMLEGGIAGSIDLNTRKPFDSNKDTQASVTLGDYWGDLAKKGTPQIAGLVSHNWNTDIGRFGVLANLAYDRIEQTDNGISLVNFQRRCNGCIVPMPAWAPSADSYPGLAEGTNGPYYYVPVGGDLRSQDETSTRFGHVLAAQWESPDKTWQATLEWDRASDTETTYEHTLQASTDGCGWSLPATCGIPLTGTTPTYDANGVFQSGTITALPNPGYTYPGYGGFPTQLDNTAFKSRYVTNDYSFNLKWNVNDRLHLSLDAQDTHSDYDYAYYYIRELTNANWYMALHGNNVPTVAVLSPDPKETAAQYFANPANTYWASAQDSHRYSWGNQRAFRLDGTFEVDKGPLDDIQFGFRHSDQGETVQDTGFNYQAVSSPSGPGANVITAGDTPGFVAPYNFDLPAFSNGNFGIVAPFFNMNPITQFWPSVAAMKQINQMWYQANQQYFAANPGSKPNPYYTTYESDLYNSPYAFIPGTSYLPQDVSANDEKTNATYLRLNFGNGNMDFLSGLQISGNVGIRYVHTQDDASGYLFLPNQQTVLNGQSIAEHCKSGPNTQAGDVFCSLTPEQQQQYLAFANGAYAPITASNSYGNWLPSFNLAVGWTDDLITRFAFSESIYRPSLIQLAAGQSVTGLMPYGTNATSTPTVEGNNGGHNPYLKPITAHNFDLTQEWYFGNAGSLTGMLFYKQLNHTIQYITNVVSTSVTNNGVTYPEQYTVGLANLDQKGSVGGAELAYQQKYDFLPGWLSGFGTQINYTYIKPHGLGFGSVNYCPTTYLTATQCTNQHKLPPQELSRDTFNFTVYYEKGPLSARLAWNWRSQFLLTNQEADFPLLPVLADPQGQLDGSLIYSLNDHVKVALQVANLLNSTFKTREVVNTDGLTVPKGFFRNDTRYNLSLRASF